MTESTTRLHISPLTPDLLPAVLGANLTKLAQNISYHSLQTFPDQPYGYLDLPTMDAEKIKKKLNGAILKGKKVKVEEARPKKRTHSDTLEQDSSAPEEAAPRQSKRSKKDRHVLPAHEMSPDRKVKRGWTEATTEKTKTKKKKKDKEKSSTKSQALSKYTEKEELLFKTKLPPNKKSTKAKDGKREKRDKSGADVVHEFKHNTTVPSFLRNSKTSDSNQAVEYEDGHGWVDQNGDVIEEESTKASKKRKAAKLGLEIDVNKAQQLDQKRKEKKSTSTPSSKHATRETISSSEESSDEELGEGNEMKTAIADADETSSSGTSSSSNSSDSESDSPSDEEGNENMAAPFINENATPPPAQQIHPLEALFKKPNAPSSTQHQPSTSASKNLETIKPTLELNTAFSFFEQGPSDSENEPEANNTLPAMPMTPFTSQDFRSRTTRSAAPTPDTADPRRSKGYASFMLGLGRDSTDSEDELSELEHESKSKSQKENNKDRDPTPTRSQSQSNPQSESTQNPELQIPQSDFEKRFWESRGENNRAWKSRRRIVLKEKRQRENRSRRPKTW